MTRLIASIAALLVCVASLALPAPGAAAVGDHIVVVVRGPVTAGTSFTVTAYMEDSSNHVVGSYSDSSPSWSDASGGLTGSPAPFVNGVSKTTTASIPSPFHHDTVSMSSGG